MIRRLLLPLLLLASPPAWAQGELTDEDEEPGMPMMQDDLWAFVLLDILEYAGGADGGELRLDSDSWIGGDWNRLWLRADADRSVQESATDIELQTLYGRLIAPYWDVLVGVRFDLRERDGELAARPLLAVGLEGLAPYWFEVEPTLFVSARGELSARITTSVDVLITQRLVAQPRFELEAAVQEVERFGVGPGVNHGEAGLRLRYEIVREFAPYVGVSYVRLFGRTAELARRESESAAGWTGTAGVRVWM